MIQSNNSICRTGITTRIQLKTKNPVPISASYTYYACCALTHSTALLAESVRTAIPHRKNTNEHADSMRAKLLLRGFRCRARIGISEKRVKSDEKVQDAWGSEASPARLN